MKAIIALTSWKKRIENVDKVIYKINKIAGSEYKIVLTLSEEEFPGKEKDLPTKLISCMNDIDGEILWEYKNYRPFKKVLFAMDKYPDVPIISTDDDCIPKINIFDILYDNWKENPDEVFTLYKENIKDIWNLRVSTPCGRGTIFPPASLNELLSVINCENILNTNNDDSLYGVWLALNPGKVNCLGFNLNDVFEYTNDENPITDGVKKYKDFIDDKKTIYNEVKKYLYNKNPGGPGVSICMTAYKAGKFIKRAIDSIYNQDWIKTHDNWELLIGIDYCEDTLNVLKKIMNGYDYHLKVFMMDSNKGTYVTSNTLLMISKYDYYMRFDSDDVLDPKFLTTIFNEIGDSDFCEYRYKWVRPDLSVIKEVSPVYSYGSIFGKTNILKYLGGYEDWPVSADADLLKCRLERFYKIKYIDEPIYWYVKNDQSLMNSPSTRKGSSIRTKYDNIWKNKVLDDIRDARIECATNTYQEVESFEYDPSFKQGSDLYGYTVNPTPVARTITQPEISECSGNFSEPVVVFTCCFNGEIPEKQHVTENVKYICFSNKPTHQNGWENVVIDSFNNDPLWGARYIMFHPNTYIKDYEKIIYIDPNVVLSCGCDLRFKEPIAMAYGENVWNEIEKLPRPNVLQRILTENDVKKSSMSRNDGFIIYNFKNPNTDKLLRSVWEKFNTKDHPLRYVFTLKQFDSFAVRTIKTR